MSDHSLDYFDEEFFTPISESALKFRAVSAACLELGSYQLGQVQSTAKISTHKGLVALDDICPVVPLAPSQLSALYFHCDADLRELVKAVDAVLLNCADHDSSYTPSAFMVSALLHFVASIAADCSAVEMQVLASRPAQRGARVAVSGPLLD